LEAIASSLPTFAATASARAVSFSTIAAYISTSFDV